MGKLLDVPTKSFFKKEWLYNKSKIIPLIIGLAFFGLFTCGMLYILPDLMKSSGFEMPPIDKDMAIQSFYDNALSIIVIIGVILTASSIAGEKEKRTMILLETKPVSKASIVLVKLSVNYLLMFIGMLAASIVFYVTTIALFGVPDFMTFVEAFLLFMFFLLLPMSLGILFSSLFKTQLSASATAIGTYFLLNLVSSLINSDSVAQYNIFQLPTGFLVISIKVVALIIDLVVIFLLTVLFLITSVIILRSQKEEVI